MTQTQQTESAERIARPLIQLAKLNGISTSYIDQLGTYVEIRDEVLVSVLAALGVDASSDEAITASYAATQQRIADTLVEPTVVKFIGKEAVTPIRAKGNDVALKLTLEDGTEYAGDLTAYLTGSNADDGSLQLTLPDDIPAGYHTLAVDAGPLHAEAALICAPARIELPPAVAEKQRWGWMAQMYSIRSAESWGVGDYGDLKLLLSDAATKSHADFMLINPIHATAPVPPLEPWFKDTNRDSPEVVKLMREHADMVDFECWLQWIADEQVTAAQNAARDSGMALGLMQDMAVGVHSLGADVWWNPERFAVGSVTVGCPPDFYNQQGQDWGQPPFNPNYLAKTGYGVYREMVHNMFSHAGAVRIDHVLGLFRLWWIPQGEGARGGAYVTYDYEAMIAILTIEASRVNGLVVGEDLGTVPDYVRTVLGEHGLLGCMVEWFARVDDSPNAGDPYADPSTYRKYALALLTGLLALFTVDYLQLKVPEIYQLVINGLNQGYIVENGVQVPFDMAFLLDRICMPMVGIILAIVFGRFLWRVTIFGAATKVETDLRDKMFRHAEDLSREYYQVNKVGNLMSLFTNDLDTVQECYGWGFMQFFDPIILCSLAITRMWRMDHLLTVLSLIPMGLLFASAAVVGKNMTRKWDYRQKCFSDLSDFAQESFSGIAVIKAFVKEAKELMAFEKLNRDSEDSNIAFTKTSVLMRILVTTFVESVICVILGYGGYLVYKGQFNAGQLMEFIGYFNAVVWPIMAVADLIDMTSRGKASLKRISELLDAPKNVFDRPGVQELTDPRGEIEFRDLSFTYPDGDIPALEHVSFTIRPGESIGLVGKTGSGKTTLVDLILRTYNVNDGQLFLDGRDVNDLSIRSVRDACAYVPQDNFLFSDTIENNIAFGKSETVSEEIRRAAKLADIDGNISEFQMGYQTVLGERGVTVSGGQKQRISIARALMKDAPILILDDSVSAVDTKTEKAILDNLRATRAGKTTILIAHRISTIEQMDKILFIEDGRLAGFDTHDKLYTENPAYRKMVDLQRLEEEGGAVNA